MFGPRCVSVRLAPWTRSTGRKRHHSPKQQWMRAAWACARLIGSAGRQRRLERLVREHDDQRRAAAHAHAAALAALADDLRAKHAAALAHASVMPRPPPALPPACA